MNNYDFVKWSVDKANAENPGTGRQYGMLCQCGKDSWRTHNGINPMYASQYNPGEYVGFTCTNCGHYIEQPS